ncbi:MULTISPECIES: hypothetical protein [Curtobacterium]|uniref:hypothetical protein n=1 Tax=Curtobacterium TaxID=2034 RepID=UPI001C8E3721|nr:MULTISPECIES: hypothetical protein [Curtobacterium]MBY0176732.1 hypothetical protein [Curtobacterium herbarum]MDN3479521.1 hypothetical protein [Curtobacterium sp. APC 4022]MDY1004699.1 hypothetical protein [Curtobacterium sp. CFBP9011]
MTEEPMEHGPGYYERLAQEDAKRRGLSSEEYGVYKGSVGSAVPPVNSASGLLIISIVLTVIMVGVTVGIGFLVAQSLGLIEPTPGDTSLDPVMWFFVLVFYVFPVWSWVYYVRERRAQKLRMSRGLPKNLS